MKQINKQLLEVHKPSGQISSKITKNGKIFSLSPTQFDSINFLCYKAREQVFNKFGDEKKLQEKINHLKTDDELFNFLSSQVFTVDINEIIEFLGAYKRKENRNKISVLIKELQSISIEMGLFKKHDLMVEKVFSLIRRYERNKNSNTIKYMLEPELIIGWVFKTKPFTKLFLKVQTKLRLTYSKILYEICKDYENIGIIEKPFKLWIYVLGIEANIKNVSSLKRDYLNKAIKEINEHTDIFIDEIKGKKEKGKTTMIVKFHKQKCDLIENNIDEFPIEKQILQNKMRIKSKTKLDKLIKNGYKVRDEDKWIETDIKKNKDLYEAQIKLDDYLNQLDDLDQDDRLELLSALAKYLNSDDPIVIIDKNDYLIKDLSNNILTTSAKETREVVLKFQEIEMENEI